MKAFAPLLLLATLSASAQTMDHMSMSPTPVPNEQLGTVSFPNSCAPASQPAINRGVALIHDFWYEEARTNFQRLTKADPACAIAHWGIAMSAFHQIWGRPSAADNTLAWGEMQQALALPTHSPIEHEYILALADFFRPGPSEYPARIAAYSAAMGTLYAAHPDQVDAGAFYALSLLAAETPDDTSLAQEHKAMAVLTPLFAKYPDNPGVVHYIIHACDNPTLAPEALTASNHYGEIAPSGAHAFHMPGHIYARLGLWQQDIASQLGSIAASEQAEAHGENGVMDEPHSYDFLIYAYLQSGQDSLAKTTLANSSKPLNTIASMPTMGGGHMPGMVTYYRNELPAFYALEMRDWKTAAALKPTAGSSAETSTLTYWARAIAHGHLHQPKQAQADLARYDALIAEIKKSKRAYVVEGTGTKIERSEILAWTAFAANQQDEALTNMRAAADLQDKVGQGEVDIPAREMLADMLLDFNHPQQALADYETALKLSPNRLNGLYNAGRAAEAAGNNAAARTFYATLLKSTSNGTNSTRPELAHAKAFTATQVATN